MESLTYSVPEELFATAESLFVSGTYDLPEFVQGADTYRFEKPLEYALTITNTGGALLVAGTVTGDAATTCGRCLEPAYYALSGEVEGYYLIPNAEVELTDEEREEYEVLGEDHLIDFAPLFSAALALEVPYMPLCREDCKGICPGCGANLNTEECTCEPADDAEDEFHPNPFAALKDYKFD